MTENLEAQQYILVFSALFICFTSFGQVDMTFSVKDSVVNKEVIDQLQSKIVSGDKGVFFEDDKYLISRTCSGEWGGTLKFKNKFTNTEYACGATCPIIVNKLDNKYIVTNTLNHLSGFTTILEIDNPESLQNIEPPKPPKKRNKRIIKYVGDDESKSDKGTIKLVDTIGVTTLISFPYNGELFYIIDNDETYLAKIVNNKFENIKLVTRERLWGYSPKILRISNEHHMVYFSNHQIEGVLDINGRYITFFRIRKE